MYHESSHVWKQLLHTGLRDDNWEWDWTSLGTVKDPSRMVSARIVAKSDGVWASSALVRAVEEVSAELGSPIRATSDVKDGARLSVGKTVCSWRGPARVLLALERPFLNLASYAGGIAYRTRTLVDLVDRQWKRTGNKWVQRPRVTSTRKILPHYRDLALHAVQTGGGHCHRVSLSGGVLIKENHIAAAGGIAAAIRGARLIAPHGLKIEIEVRNLKELSLAVSEHADVVMLDNFSPSEVEEALRTLDAGSKPLIEVSGGIDEQSIMEYVMPGVDIISIGSLTHSVRAIDLSLLVSKK